MESPAWGQRHCRRKLLRPKWPRLSSGAQCSTLPVASVFGVMSAFRTEPEAPSENHRGRHPELQVEPLSSQSVEMKMLLQAVVTVLLTPWAASHSYAATAGNDLQQHRGKAYAGLPNLADFQTNRSDHFLVDLQYVSAG